MAGEGRRFGIGYVLLPKKENSFIRESLVKLARSLGIDLVKIDPRRPLVEQGPFDCVLHKLYGEDWKSQLQDFRYENPNAVILDSPAAIGRLHDRISMLQVVSELMIESQNETFGIPKQIVIYDQETLFDNQAWELLKFPVIAKPLVADGSAKTHKMSLVFNHEGLNKLKPPIVLQEFVNHGGVIFKVYVVGEYVKCVKRKLLPDVSKEKLNSLEDSLSFSQVSNLATHQKSDDKYFKMMHLEDTELPPRSFMTDIARGLRRAMNLNLFNFDVIRDTRFGNRYLIIDINYFPGYAKMPGYETVLTDFFCDMVYWKDKEVAVVKDLDHLVEEFSQDVAIAAAADGRQALSCEEEVRKLCPILAVVKGKRWRTLFKFDKTVSVLDENGVAWFVFVAGRYGRVGILVLACGGEANFTISIVLDISSCNGEIARLRTSSLVVVFLTTVAWCSQC